MVLPNFVHESPALLAADRLAGRDILQAAEILLTPEFEECLDEEAWEQIVLGGWRGGKTTVGYAKLLASLPRWWRRNTAHGESTLAWLVGPDYGQTNEEFRHLFAKCTKLELLDRVPSNPQEGSKTLWLKGNITITTKSGKHPETLGSVAPDAILGCEAGQMPDAVRLMLKGRAMEKNAPLVWTGTLEDDDAHETWAWYQELGDAWLHNRTFEHAAHSLPSWANAFLYGDCRKELFKDPNLAFYCPNENHPHRGRDHPTIRKFEADYPQFVFERKIAGIPNGVQYAVYPQFDYKEHELTDSVTIDKIYERRLINAVGGIDYGTTETHPMTLAGVHVFYDPRDLEQSFVGPQGIAVVRESWLDNQTGGDSFVLQRERKRMAETLRIWRWATDPNERFMAKASFADPVSGSDGARDHRTGLMQARLNLNKIYFDTRGPGVAALVKEMKRVRRRKRNDGKLVLVRIDDDRTAALEDAIELLDGKELLKVPKPTTLKPRIRLQYGRHEFTRVG